MVSQIRGAIERLTHINELPDDVVHKLLKMFQTTSVEDFSASFKLLEKQRAPSQFTASAGPSSPLLSSAEAELPGTLCDLAESLRHEKCKTGEWSGASAEGRESVSSAAGATSGPTRWNCGNEGHALSPRVPNQE